MYYLRSVNLWTTVNHELSINKKYQGVAMKKSTNMKLAIGGAIGLSALLLTGCATQMPVGTMYSNVKGQWTTGEKVNNGVDITKEGKSCSHSYLAMVAVGDNSIETAQKNGGIKNVASVSYSSNNILGFIGTYCTTVKGN